MIKIRDPADLACVFDGMLEIELRRLLAQRRDQQSDNGTLVRFIIVRPSDTLADVEAEAGQPLAGGSARFGRQARHSGGWIEAPVVADNDGTAVVILARDCIATDPGLLSALRRARLT